MLDTKKYNILYVDDEQHNLNSFKAAFRRHYNVYTALGAKEGIEVLNTNPIHLIITDQRMPEMTGVEFLEKAIGLYPETIRMILTGFSDVEDIIRAINTGRIYRYITKPWQELSYVLRGCLYIYCGFRIRCLYFMFSMCQVCWALL
jgi:response regulator RpfG family c-di-GMP phosphodiesterase